MVIDGSRAALTVCTSHFPVVSTCSIVLNLISGADVINISCYRLSTAEIESTLIMHAGVVEAAIIAAEDELAGHTVFAFVKLKPEFTYDDVASLIKELMLHAHKVIEPLAAPKIIIVSDLPKTHSEKVCLPMFQSDLHAHILILIPL